MPGYFELAALSTFCLAAVFYDLRTGRIPNLLNAAGFVSGAVIASARGGAAGLAWSTAGALLGLAVLLLPFLLHMVGGGDVKFLAAAGSIVGWRVLWVAFLAGAGIGGLAAVILIVFRDRSLSRIRERIVLLEAGILRRPSSLRLDGERTKGRREADRGPGMPYAVPLSIGLLLVTTIRCLP